MGNRYPMNGYETMASGYTNGLYLPSKPLDEWNIDECRRALCRQANGDVMHCLDCENKCRYGRRIEVLLAPVESVEEQVTEKPNITQSKRAAGPAASAEARKRKSKIRYLRMIASGDPKAYLEAHGMEIRNNMCRLRTLYKDVTPEEARKLLEEMGETVEDVQVQPVEETVTEQQMIVAEVESVSDALPETSENSGQLSEPEPAKPAGVMLHVHALSGDWFRYTRTVEGGIYIEPNTACIATDVANVDAICAEIRAAFNMMQA